MRRLLTLLLVPCTFAVLNAQAPAPAQHSAVKPGVPAATAPAAPGTPPPSPEKRAKAEKVVTLLKVNTEIEALSKQIHDNIDRTVTQVTAQAGSTPTADQQKLTADYKSQVKTIGDNSISWEKLKPTVIEAYATTYSNADLDAFITFFGSAAGQDYLTKNPDAAKQISAAIQQNMAGLRPQLMQVTRDYQEKMKAAAPPKLSSPLEAPAPATPKAPTPAPAAH